MQSGVSSARLWSLHLPRTPRNCLARVSRGGANGAMRSRTAEWPSQRRHCKTWRETGTRARLWKRAATVVRFCLFAGQPEWGVRTHFTVLPDSRELESNVFFFFFWILSVARKKNIDFAMFFLFFWVVPVLLRSHDLQSPYAYHPFVDKWLDRDGVLYFYFFELGTVQNWKSKNSYKCFESLEIFARRRRRGQTNTEKIFSTNIKQNR